MSVCPKRPATTIVALALVPNVETQQGHAWERHATRLLERCKYCRAVRFLDDPPPPKAA